MNWGHKITGVIIVFVGMIMFMVVKAMRQDNIHLVSKDYYKEEIEYQKEINKLKNVQNLKEGFAFQYISKHQTFKLKFPKNTTQGQVTFFRPANARKDFTVPVETGTDGIQLIPIANCKFDKGFWRVKINWQDAQKKYYVEKRIIIAKDGNVEIKG
ncbi:FixH family protein [Microscilla marina]|uniref:FixH protein n=1 Tax=Microscilla marina ATCC 23134 TaxID=313606 RepID=A1ZN73_MICM2|nr:FixH family protein [Microscilla marina]EAY28254.1 hypothetical protein M23134_03515 [Microscilla marina ATCC 23134]